MFGRYVRRGAVAGLLAGLAFGVGAAATGGAEHAHHALVPPALATLAAGVGWGATLGAAFGAAFFLLEPRLPARGDYALAAAGFLTVSGAPWLALPPGVESTLPADMRVGWYAGMMVAGAVACAPALLVRERRWALAVAAAVALPALGSLAPAPAGVAALGAWGDAPAIVGGQLGLWAALAAVHARLRRRDAGGATATGADPVSREPTR